MKVLEVFGEPISNGGQESFVINLIEHMDLEGLTIDLLTPYYCDNDFYEQKVTQWGGKIISFGLDFQPGQSRFNINKYIDKYLQENTYDVLHVHSGSISVLAIMAYYAKKNGVKKVITHSHCAVEHINLKNKILRVIAGIFMKPCVDVYCACSKVAGEAKYMPGIVNDKMIVLNNGVDFSRFEYNESIRDRIREKHNIKKDAFVLGHVGRFSYQKNHEYLIQIFKDVLKREKNAVLMLIGSGELEEEIQQLIKEFNLTDSVILCGNVNNVNEYMQAMDVFVLPSRFEGLPIVGVEAQAAGLPVVVSENVSDELDMGKNVAFLPLSEDVKMWVDKILELKGDRYLENTQLLREHGYDVYQTASIVRDMYIE